MKVKEVEIELSFEEAKELAEMLSKMSGLEPKVVEKHIHHGYWWPYYYPTWVGTRPYDATWGSDNTADYKLSDNVNVSYQLTN